MNWRMILFIFFAVSLGLSSFAHADSESGYLGLGGGSTLPEGGPLDDAVGWKVFLGYKTNNKASFEAGYTSFGKMKNPSLRGSSPSVEPRGFEIALSEWYPINPQFAFFLKLGLLEWDFKVNKAGSTSSKTSGRDIFFGAGWEYDVLGNWGARAAWDRYKIEGRNFDFLAGSLVYRFK